MSIRNEPSAPPRRGRALSPCLLVGLAVLSLAPGVARAQQPAERQQATLEELAAYATPAVVLIDVATASDTRQGSGFLVDASGRILTNYHVIRDARTAKVKLPNGDVYEDVEVLAQDERRDLAVIQIAGFDLPSLPLGNSESVRIGAPVVLIGSPLGLANTVSTGIVSGRRQEDEGYHVLQVTAPASPGSSGGPVLSVDGSVIGVASSQFRAGQNLNFAVPINYARGLLEHLAREPIAVLGPTRSAPHEGEMARPVPQRERSVNKGLTFGAEGFRGYQVETRTVLGKDRERLTRVSYRLIEPIGDGPRQVERYMESETVSFSGPFGTRQTVRRERSRAVVLREGLDPLSARGERTWWSDQGWVTSSYDLRFENGHAIGTVDDTTGAEASVDRAVPDGIVLHDLRELAFGLVEADSLVGRSVELTTFDPRTAEVRTDRYDIRADTTVEVAGTRYEALQVNLATGLSNQTLWFRKKSPRLFLRRVDEESGEIEEVLSFQAFPPGVR